MELADLNQLIKTGKATLAAHALIEWEKNFSYQSEPLINALKLNDPAVLEQALKLAEKYHPAICASFVAALLKSGDPLTRRLAVQSLSTSMGTNASEGLKVLFTSESDVFVLASAVTAAAKLNIGLEYVTPYFTHSDVRLRANAVRAAAVLGRSQLPQLLEPFLADKALRVQNEALKGLATLASEADLETLVIQRLTSPDAPTRAATIFITGELPLGRRVVFLINALTDLDPRVTGCAVRSLAILRDPLGLRALIETYLNTPDDVFARMIIKQLAPADGERIITMADILARPVTCSALLSGRILLAADSMKPWELFLPWILGAANRKEPELRQHALKIIASHIEFFRGNVVPLLEKAETAGDLKDKALAALIRWKSGQTEGFKQLQAMLFSLKAAESKVALEVLDGEKGLMAKKLLEEAKARGLTSSPPSEPDNQPAPAFKLPTS